MATKGTMKNSEHQKKRKSRDAARSRRGQQNDEYSELANQLPLPLCVSKHLDRLCVMRLVNSYIKMKQLMDFMMNQDVKKFASFSGSDEELCDKALLEALDGFVFVVTSDGQCLYVSDNVNHYLGLSQIEISGNSFYKYVHPCDHEELSNQLGGQIPLEDMEIFDGLYCSDSVFMMSNLLKGGSKHKQNIDNPFRSFFVRMKSTLTSRGKSVNLKASTYRVIHCTGCVKVSTTVAEDGTQENAPHFMVAIGVPLMVASNFEVPVDRCTFTSRHSLDMKILSCDDKVQDLLGYAPAEIIGKSWYQFQHACDLDTALACHKTLLTKGQSVSKYYRFLVRGGGWAWLQSKANIVYDSKTCQPQFILGINYLVGGIEKEEHVLSTEQINPVPLGRALETLGEVEEAKKRRRSKRRKDSIVLQERTKLLKAAIHEKNVMTDVQAKAEPKQVDCCLKEPQDGGESTGLDCEPMNFQDCFPVAWDISNDLLNEEKHFEQYTDTPQMSPVSEDRAPSIPSPDKDESLQCQQKEGKGHGKTIVQCEENFDERAPFIPPPGGDAGLEIDNEMLLEIPFMDSPMTPSFSWLLDGDLSLDSEGPTPSSTDTVLPLLDFKPENQSTLARKTIPTAERESAYAPNDMLRGKLLPFVTTHDAEVNAPVGPSYMLRGEELLRALDCDNFV